MNPLLIQHKVPKTTMDYAVCNPGTIFLKGPKCHFTKNSSQNCATAITKMLHLDFVYLYPQKNGPNMFKYNG